jgi:hypothetical protein
MPFPVNDWQFWVVTAVVAIVALIAIRAVVRGLSARRPPRRVDLTIDRAPKK